jgi:hypothetical protein
VDIADTLAPKSDQLDFEDLIPGPRTFTITAVRKGPSAEQPVQIDLAEFDRPWRPGKTMRRLLVAAWGPDASEYVGRQVTLYGDPTVRFGGVAVGGTRISHLSHIDKPTTVMLMVTRGKRQPFVVQPIGKTKAADPVAAAVEHFETTFGVTRDELETRLGKSAGDWTGDDLEFLRELSKALHSGDKEIADEFPEQAS